MRLVIWHNLLWSRYKAVVFSSLHEQAQRHGSEVFVYQIAETEADRAAISPVDLSWHNYPYKLLFEGNHARIPKLRLYWRVLRETWNSPADFTILACYDRPEYWLQAALLTLLGRRFGVFCDSTYYDKPQAPLKGFAKRIFFSFCDAIFCYGARASEYARHYGTPQDKIVTRCQTAALPKSYTPAAALALRIQNAPSTESPRYLYVGRLSAEKSINTLLRAFQRVSRRQPKADLVIVGRGPQEAELRALAKDLAIEDRVEFAGAKYDDALAHEYARATSLVLPSRSEPWGLVANEALSYGCPIVVSDRCGCVPELVLEGVTGYAFEWGDIGDLADKMLRVSGGSHDVEATSSKCIKHVSQYTPEAAARSILEGCNQAIERLRPDLRKSAWRVQP